MENLRKNELFDSRDKIATLLTKFLENSNSLEKEELILLTREIIRNENMIIQNTDLYFCKICKLITEMNYPSLSICYDCSEMFIVGHFGSGYYLLYLDFLIFNFDDSEEILDKLIISNHKWNDAKFAKDNLDLLKFIDDKTIKTVEDFFELYEKDKFLVLNYSIYQYYRNKKRCKYKYTLFSAFETDKFEEYILMNKTRFCYFSGQRYWIAMKSSIHAEIKTTLLALNRIPMNILPRPLKRKIFRYFLDN